MATEFERLSSGGDGAAIRRGRPSRLTPEQKRQRIERQRAMNRLRNEARRRAHIVLQHRYENEFRSLMEEEISNLAQQERYQIPAI